MRKRKPLTPGKSRRRAAALPRIGPCHDALRLWFLEFRIKDARLVANVLGQHVAERLPGGLARRYYADGEEARRALHIFKTTGRVVASGSSELHEDGE